MLGESRQKSLATDLLGDDELVADRASRIADSDHGGAEEARTEAERRLASLAAERAELGLFQRARRAELDEQIELQRRAINHWETELARPVAEPRAMQALAPTLEPEELRCLVANSSRPVSLWEREPWADAVIRGADPDLDFHPGPEIDVPGPDLDFGP
ncbi:MAG TPA: hypothetical protein VF529_09580 [Solirubrobacteraceae bacterium]|jgi:hypothetical protein